MLDIADALEANESLIKAENQADIAAAIEAGKDRPLVSRLTLKPGKASPFQVSLIFFPLKISDLMPCTFVKACSTIVFDMLVPDLAYSFHRYLVLQDLFVNSPTWKSLLVLFQGEQRSVIVFMDN